MEMKVTIGFGLVVLVVELIFLLLSIFGALTVPLWIWAAWLLLGIVVIGTGH